MLNQCYYQVASIILLSLHDASINCSRMKKKTQRETSMDDLVSISEAARLRGVTHAAIQDLIARDRLSVIEVAGRRLLKRADVVGFEPQPPRGKGRKAK
jgi:hypothetical protein